MKHVFESSLGPPEAMFLSGVHHIWCHCCLQWVSVLDLDIDDCESSEPCHACV